MALPTFVAAGSPVSSLSAITVPLPAGIAVNDILYFEIETRSGQAITVANANGGTWTAMTARDVTGTVATRLNGFWSRYNGTQGDPTTSDSGDHQIGVILAFRGCTLSDPPHEGQAGSVDATVDTTLTATGLTTAGPDRLVLVVAARDTDDATAQYSAWANADLANITELFDAGTTQGNGGGLGIITGEKAAAGTVGNTTATLATGTSDAFNTIALIPAITGGASLSAAGAVASAEATGTARIVRSEQTIGVASAESFGQARLTRTSGPAGIASAQAVGQPRLSRAEAPIGIASASAFGTAKITRTVGPAGVASAQAVAAPRVTRAVDDAGIASAEAFGTARLTRNVRVTGIASGEAFGTPSVAGPQAVTGVGAIGSGEAFGVATLTGGTVPSVAPPGGGGFVIIPVGQPEPEKKPERPRKPSRQTVAAHGIPTAETVGRPAATHDLAAPDTLRALRRLALRKRVPVPGVDSLEQIGAPVVRQLLPLQSPVHAARLDGPLPRPVPGGTFTARGDLATIELPPQPAPVMRDSDDEELLLLLDLV